MRVLLAVPLFMIATTAFAQQGDRAGEAQPPLPATLEIPPAPPLDPADALGTFTVPRGLRVELAAAEPLVIAPVAMDIGLDGRLWVVEMPTYMNDLDGSRELEPTGRIVILEDSDQDGRMDTRTVFLDELVLPRALALVDGGALVVAPPNLLLALDTDGDDRADVTTVVDDSFAGLQSPEHAGNGLRYGMDNWLHCAQHPWEYRFDEGVLERRAVPPHGQWGLTADAWDRWYYTPNSYPLLMDLVDKHIVAMNPNQHDARGVYMHLPADLQVHASRINPGVNRGYQDATLNDDYTLRNFTAACGPVIYLDTVLGREYEGDAFICEPSGNTVEHRNLMPRGAQPPQARREQGIGAVLASTDERFRPVHAAVGSDGALYILDMYRGILQHKIFMTSFLRQQVLDRNLQSPIDRGRIWRLVPDDSTERSLPNMEDASLESLVASLGNRNGTVRLLAQRQLVSMKDPGSIPLLERVVMDDEDPLARAHALWTLDGMDQLDVNVLTQAFLDDEPLLRRQAMRVSGRHVDTPAILDHLLLSLHDTDTTVRRHAAGALAGAETSEILAELVAALDRNPHDDVLRTLIVAGARDEEVQLLEELAWQEHWTEETEQRLDLLASIARSAMRSSSSEQRVRLMELLASLPAEQDWMTHAMAEQVVEAQRLRTGTPRRIELEEVPFDWEARLQEQGDVAGGLLQLINTHLDWPGRPGYVPRVETAGLGPAEAALVERGAELYVHCTGCHQATGAGLSGFYPPLVDSDLVLGEPEPLLAILIHGIEGLMSIRGVHYNQQMPPSPFPADEDIAAIASYVRTAWTNDAGVVHADLVASVRKATSGHRGPWSMKSLKEVFPSVP